MSALALYGLAGGVACVMTAHIHAMFCVRSRFIPGTMCRLPKDGTSTVALTFDDGPHPSATPAILDVLGEAGVPAAFFMIGSRVTQYPGVAEQVMAAGHTIGNHSYAHRYSGLLRGFRFWCNELESTARVIEDACGVRTSWFRPPIGHRSLRQERAVRSSGHRTIGWSCRGLDGLDHDVDRIVSRVRSSITARDIVLLHDGVDPNRSRDWRATASSLKVLLPELMDRGYQFSSLPAPRVRGG